MQIPSDGDWRFTLSLLGEARLEMWDNFGIKYHQDFKSRGIHNTYTDERGAGIQSFRAKKGDVFKFKIKYTTTGLNQLIWFQWYNESGGNTPKAPNLPNYTSTHSIGNMGVIPYEYFKIDPPPQKNVEYKIVEKEFAKALVKQPSKGFSWLWNSPLRTKVAGGKNEYCLIAGVKQSNGTYEPYTQEQKRMYVAFLYDIIEEKNNAFTTRRVQYPLRANNTPTTYTTKKEAPYVDLSASCFSLSTDRIVTKMGQFAVSETEMTASQVNINDQNRISKNSNNPFAIRPSGYKATFTDLDSGELIKAQNEDRDSGILISQMPNSKVVLTAGKKYKVNISAQAVDYDETGRELHKFRDINSTRQGLASGLYFSTLKDTKLVPIINSNMTCSNTNSVNFGKAIDQNKNIFGVIFRNAKVSFTAGDIQHNIPNDNDNQNVTIPFYHTNNTYSQYIDVMKFKTQIEDTEWTAVNFSDIKNYNSLSNEEKARVRNQVQKYGYQCRGHKINGVSVSTAFDNSLEDCDINLVSPRFVEFVPAGFEIDISDTNTINGASGFTYINDIKSNDITSPSTTPKTHDMLAKLKLKIKALGSGNSINNQWLSNFSNTCYATDVNVTISYSGDKYIKNPSSVDSIADTNLKNNLKNYLQAKRLFAFGDDINASKRMSFDENSSYKTSPYAVISFNKLNSGYKSSSYNARSATYSDFDSSSSVNKAHYTISKNAFSIHERQMNTTSNVEHNRYTTGVNIGFNFTRSKDKADNPFIIAPIEFDIEPITYKSRPITTNVIKGSYTSNYEPTKVATMLYGRVYAPFYEGPKSGFIEKIYYGYYDSKGCATTSRLQGISGDYLPQISNYCVNLKHDNPAYGYWQNYSSNNNTSMTRVNPMSGSTGSFTKITNPSNPSQVISVSELVRFSNTKATRDEIRLNMPKYPWLIFNDSGLDYNSFPIQFHDEVNFNDWGGKAYDKSGNETGVGNFIFDNDKVPVRTNRRIDW